MADCSVSSTKMIRAAVVLCCVGLALALPPVSRSREDIEAFRSFLESTKTNDGSYLTRARFNPLANPEENSGKYQGDILLDDWQVEAMMQQYAAGRNAYTWPNTKWPNDTVVWEFGEGEFGPLQQAAIEEGIADIERHTCVKFRKREKNEPVFVRLTGDAGGCYAHVGYWQSRGIHTLNLARNYPGVGCFRHATIVHEWMHILGFLHMQSTHDRDDYVRIVEENLISGTEHNFDIYGPNLVDNLGVEYDYVSCLHYGPYAFTSNGEKTIVALHEHEGTMGQREYITDKDWLRINRHYNCPGAWDEKEESEENRSESEENKSDSEENKSESEESKSESSEQNKSESEESKSESSEQNKSESSEQNKSESSEQNKSESSEQNNSESSEQNNSESSEQDKSESSEQNNSESSEQDKSESSEQNKSESSEQDKSESSEQNKSESSEQDQSESSEQNKSESSEQNKSKSSEQNKSESSEQNKSESSEQNNSESSEQDKSESSEQDKSESSEQNKSESSEQNKSESSEQDQSESSEQNKSESSEQNKSESSEQNKSESSEQNKSESSEQDKSESSNQNTSENETEESEE